MGLDIAPPRGEPRSMDRDRTEPAAASRDEAEAGSPTAPSSSDGLSNRRQRARARVEERLTTWPNLFTMIRMAMAPLFLLARGDAERGAVLAVAGLTEWLDGWLARRLEQTSRIGEVLDPIADRLFMVCALAAFLADGRILLWELAVLLARDIFTALTGVVVLALGLRVRLKARRAGKWVTTLQLFTLVLLLVRPAWILPAVAVVGAASLVAIVDYAVAGLCSPRRQDVPFQEG